MAKKKINETALRKELRLMIREELAKCNANVTPNLCKRIGTKEGYQKVEDMVINYAIHNNMSIQSAISQIDTELS